MVSSTRKYAAIGLRQDKNLTDIDNKVLALNNLLNDLVTDSDPNTDFTSDDLNVIRSLQSKNLNLEKISDIAGITVKYTDLTEVNGVTITTELPVEPAIRIKDRIENAKSITGEIPGILGGLGPLARFIPSYDWNTGTQSSTGSTIFNITAEQETEVFWAQGYFNFAGAIDKTFGDQYGGIQWTGYFAPWMNDIDPVITFRTSGMFMFEYDQYENNTWTQLRSIYAPVRTLQVLSDNTADPTIIQLSPGQAKYTAIDDLIDVENQITVTDVNLSTDVITLSSAYPVTANSTITLTMVLGDTTVRGTLSLPFIEFGQQLKIRISWWFPRTGYPIIRNKELALNYWSGSDLIYPFLYAEKPNTVYGPFEIRKYLTEVVSPCQPNVGLSGANKKLYISNSFYTNYTPKGSFAENKLLGPVIANFTTENNTMRTSASFLGSEIGSVITPTTTLALTNIKRFLQIKKSYSNTIKSVTSNLGGIISESVTVMNHRGLVTWFYGTVNGTNITILDSGTDVAGLRTEMIIVPNRTLVISSITTGATTTVTTSTAHGFVQTQTIYITGANITALNGTFAITSITNATQFVISANTTGSTYTANSGKAYPSFTRISTITKTNSLPTSLTTNYPLQPTGIDVQTILYVYSSRGLIDTTRDVACTGVFGYNLSTTVAAGATQLVLTSVTGVANGQVVQFDGSITMGTTVTNVNTGTNTITLSAPTIGEIKSPSIIVFAPAGTLVSLEACVIPADTAPPFVGTPEGLSTNGKGIKSALSVTSFTVNSDTLELNIPTTDITKLTAAQTVTATFNRKLKVNTTYTILGTT